MGSMPLVRMDQPGDDALDLNDMFTSDKKDGDLDLNLVDDTLAWMLSDSD
jgi:hypothetical protein